MVWPPVTHQDVQDRIDALGSGGSRLTPMMPSLPSIGHWVSPNIAATSDNAWPKGMMRLCPFWLPAGTYDATGFYVNTAGSAGAVCKVVGYADSGLGRPGALLFETATADTSTTGSKILTLPSPLVIGGAGAIVWTSTINQGSSTTDARIPTTSGGQGTQTLSPNGPDFRFAGVIAWEVNGVTGAAPNPAPASPTMTSTGSIVGYRRSA